MNKLYYILLLIFLKSIDLHAQDLSQEQIKQDFEYLNNALAEGHPGLYWFNSKEKLKETTDKVEAELEAVTNVNELHSLFVDIINTISCGHTAVMLPDARYKEVDSINHFLPFNIVLVEGKVLIAESFTSNLARGDQILSINGEPIHEIVKQLQRFIPLDKGIASKRARSIEIVFPYYYAVYIGSSQVFTLEYKTPENGKMLSKEVNTIGKHEHMFKSVREFAPAQVPLELSIDNSKHIAILKLATFGGQSFKKHEINFKDSIKGVFKYLEENKISNLIIDLRWNNGGNMRFAEYLFSFFVDSTYRYYLDAKIKQPVMEGTTKYTRTRNMLPMLVKQFGVLTPKDGIYYLSGEKNPVNPTTPRFKGDLYLLTNGFSFSATSAFIAHVQQNELGLVIGETPGGAFAGINAGPPVIAELPNSKIRLFYRPIGSKYNVDANKVSTTVDVEIENTLAGFTQRKDLQLEYIMKRLSDND